MADNVCKKCGNNLYGNKIKCPFCGEPIKGGNTYSSSGSSYSSNNSNNSNYNNNSNTNYNTNSSSNYSSGYRPTYSPDTGGAGWGFLGFCIPIVGIVLYFVWKNEKPNTAKACLNGALISIGLSIFLNFVAACASAM